MQATQIDKRNRIGVLLYKSDRGTTKYYCHMCRNFVAELAGTEVKTLTDIVHDPTGVSIRCSGSIQPGLKCHLWHTFMLGEA